MERSEIEIRKQPNHDKFAELCELAWRGFSSTVIETIEISTDSDQLELPPSQYVAQQFAGAISTTNLNCIPKVITNKQPLTKRDKCQAEL